MNSEDAVTDYLLLLAAGDAVRVLAMFGGEPIIDDPLRGRAVGNEAVLRFVADASAWLRERDARVSPLRTTQGSGRAVAEAVLDLSAEATRIELPIAVVGEQDGTGGLRELRVYHSTWPLNGSHRLRPALLPPRDDLALPEVVERYQRALADGSLEDILAVFEPDAYAREPSGGANLHRGPAGLRVFYAGLFAVGGIPLEHCTVADDGICCAIEYNVVRWGAAQVAPQAGVAVYERGPSGLLAAARIYDDVAIEEGATA